MEDSDTMMTVDQVADLLRCHPSTVYRLLKQRRLPGFKLMADWRFSKAEVLKWIKANQITPEPPR